MSEKPLSNKTTAGFYPQFGRAVELKIVYFPCEVGNREYPGRLLLGAYLALTGWTTVVGHKGVVDTLIPQLGPGVYITKDSCAPTSKRLAYARSLGCVVGAIDEELFDFASTKFGSLTDFEITQLEYFLTPSFSQAASFYIAGNRFSSMIAETRAFSNVVSLPSLRTVFARYWGARVQEDASSGAAGIVFPTHLGTINSLSLAELMCISARTRVTSVSDLITEQLDLLSLDVKHLRATEDFLGACDRSHQKVTLRPHPGEFKFGIYELLKEKYKCITSIDDGKLPIICNQVEALKLVTTSCSSLIEGALAGLPVVSIGRDRETLVSANAVSVIPADKFLSNLELRSEIDWPFVYSEFMIQGKSYLDMLTDWQEFLDSIAPVNTKTKESRFSPAPINLDGYMRRRIGALSAEYLGRLIAPFLSMNGSSQITVSGNEYVVVLS